LLSEIVDQLKNRIHEPGKEMFIQVIKPEEAIDNSLIRMYKRVGGARGSIANVHQTQSLNPEAMKSHLDLYMNIVYSYNEELSRRTRELIATAVSFVNSCRYCIVHHYEALKAHWPEAPEIHNIFSNPEESGITETEKVILEFSVKLTMEPYNMREFDVGRLRDKKLSDKSILDIILICSYFNFVNRLTLATGCPLESETERNYKY
jgi:uncharacterized peroxidase-related enzyme